MFRCSSSTLLALGLFSLDSAMAAIDVGGSHACTTVGKSLKCWGQNKWGQLGRGDQNVTGDDPEEMGDRLITVNLGTGETAVGMALGEEHSCVMLDSGGTKCFGQNDDGQLGLGDTEPRGRLPSELGDALPEVDFGTGLSATAMTTGCSHTCGLLSDGSVKCFGYNNYGQLGQGSTDNVGDEPGHMGDDLPAVPLDGESAVAIAAGCDFTCAILEGGAVKCWGRNTWGQLGTGDRADRLDGDIAGLVTVNLDGSSAKSIAAGETHVCVLNQDTSLKCWGRNNKGQLGLGDTIDRGDDPLLLGANLTAVILGDTDIPTAIDLGIEYTCVLLQDGAVKCFGENADGQLGIGSRTDIGGDPMQMGDNLVAVDLGGSAMDLAVGDASACAVLSDDSIKCWGRGNNGQLGQGDDENIGDVAGVLAELPPVDVGTDASITPAPSSPVTAAPSVASSSPSTVPSIPIDPTATLAPGATNAPTMFGDTASPSAELEIRSNSASGIHFSAGLLATVVLGAAGFIGNFLP